MKRRYDTTFIIDGNLPDSERQALIERFAATLRRSGGEIDQIIRWGLRSLAYTINKRSHGYYVIFYYLAEPAVIAAFERELRLNEFILRYMTLVYEGKHPEYIRDEGSSDAEAAKISAASIEESAADDDDDDAVDAIDEDEMESDLGIDADDADDEADSTDKEKE
jgi:small subunit ribosomal protein S6